jgi:ATP-dependent RNA helicase DDX54/DBP10
MPHRAVSPTVSENELDITNALAIDDDNDSVIGEETGLPTKVKAKPEKTADDNDLDMNLEVGEDEDDEDYIAAQQAASNRKSSNIKGRSVKKGGGFQAMGE